MFVILTSKPGQYRTEIGEGLEPVERYDYTLCGRTRARFVIARLAGPTRVRVVDETPPPVVNYVPSKFLPRFETLEGARRELADLARSGGGDFGLTPVAL
ncbi:MAG TPA: ferredoxin [Usitatibacter sp.]|nr:ferredoxin [Usitatibacter sp.]